MEDRSIVDFLMKGEFNMKIETNLATLVSAGLVIFIGGEVVGYYKCKVCLEKEIIKELKNIGN